MDRESTKLWVDTLEVIRQIKKLTKEPQVLIVHRLVVAELNRLELENKSPAGPPVTGQT
jgi:hypothetical protein